MSKVNCIWAQKASRRLSHSAPLHRDIENVIGGDLYRRRRLVQAVAEQWVQLGGNLLGRVDQHPHPRRIVLFQGPHHGGLERLASFHAEFEALGADTADQILAPRK